MLFFFFFKQKTAYEIGVRLVGSEMCIRDRVVDGLQTLARDREVEIKVSAPPEPLIVLGDRDELVRALENLVENALKYAAAGKRVDIALTRAQTRASTPEARIAVRDFGPGICLLYTSDAA